MKKIGTHKKVRGGRPLKLNDELTELLCTFLKDGAYVETAAAAAGIRKDTFYDWLKKGASSPKSIYGRFSDAIQKAMAESELNDLSRVSAAASKGNWNAAAWRLERRNPKRWGMAKRVDVDSDDDEDDTFTLNYALDEKKK